MAVVKVKDNNGVWKTVPFSGGGITGVVSVAQGGTGATSVASARTNLDVYSKSEVQSLINSSIGNALNASY